MPTIVFTTTKFVDLLQLSSDMLGGDAPRAVVVPHPLGGVTEDGVLAYVPDATDAVIRMLETSD